jgi:hypothetical protein
VTTGQNAVTICPSRNKAAVETKEYGLGATGSESQIRSTSDFRSSAYHQRFGSGPYGFSFLIQPLVKDALTYYLSYLSYLSCLSPLRAFGGR